MATTTTVIVILVVQYVIHGTNTHNTYKQQQHRFNIDNHSRNSDNNIRSSLLSPVPIQELPARGLGTFGSLQDTRHFKLLQLRGSCRKSSLSIRQPAKRQKRSSCFSLSNKKTKFRFAARSGQERLGATKRSPRRLVAGQISLELWLRDPQALFLCSLMQTGHGGLSVSLLHTLSRSTSDENLKK